ncbi:tyrosine-type recombinase/integrase [Candidatus Enterococcus ferrettii]|uniref:Integrase n=1 Tax=Candidatus Enterococcus ferrettii TaxID=2815324 RepID=A0ABV0EWK9_9ENTE|nr:site-specific integrase [Enterococcus sp. 665A]MBO1342122.1 site-specific integrase [Enterococcus sp. 665A]
MWNEPTKDGKFKFIERYKDPYTEKIKRKSTIMSSDSAQAWKKAQKILDKKISEALNERPNTRTSFHKVYKEWYKIHEKTLRPSSKSSYQSVSKLILDYIDEEVIISNIDAHYLQTFLSSLEYSHQYCLHLKSLLNLMFQYALKMNYITQNPLLNVTIHRKPKTLEEINKINQKYLERKEAELLIKELYRRPSSYRTGRLSEFLFLTGARIGEAVILTENDFDFENKTVHISGTIDYTNGYKKARKGPPKTTKSNRIIDLTDRTILLVKKSIEENKLNQLSKENYPKTDYIFTSKNGVPMQVNSFNLTLKRAGKRVHLDNKDLSSHIFRHTHVSLLAEKNIPLKAIMDRVGHEDADTTNRIYTHVTSKMKTSIVIQLEESGL